MPSLIQRSLAAVGLVVLGPLILGLGLAVRLTSPGPAFHRATRVRPAGTFTIYKLRTMRADASSSGPGITAREVDYFQQLVLQEWTELFVQT